MIDFWKIVFSKKGHTDIVCPHLFLLQCDSDSPCLEGDVCVPSPGTWAELCDTPAS